jgi:hypothetical protein
VTKDAVATRAVAVLASNAIGSNKIQNSLERIEPGYARLQFRLAGEKRRAKLVLLNASLAALHFFDFHPERIHLCIVDASWKSVIKSSDSVGKSSDRGRRVMVEEERITLPQSLTQPLSNETVHFLRHFIIGDCPHT